MDYFKKNGRTTDDEQAIILVIERLITDKQIPRAEIPQCKTLDDLIEVKHLLEAYVSKVQKQPEQPKVVVDEDSKPTEIHAETIQENNSVAVESETADSEIDLPPIEGISLPEIEGVLQKGQQEQPAEVKEKPKPSGKPNFVADDYDPFSDEIKQRSYNFQGSQPNGSQKTTQTNASAEEDLPESDETPLDNLNPKTKRRVAEQTADTLLKVYAKIAPEPFKKLAKINVGKMEKLHFEGEIDMNIEVSEGETFEEYMRKTNEQVDEMFEIEEDTLEEIREPLIEVLLEQKMELTPKQRLGMAIVSHLIQMLSVAIKLYSQNNRILEFQKRATIMAHQRAAAA